MVKCNSSTSREETRNVSRKLANVSHHETLKPQRVRPRKDVETKYLLELNWEMYCFLIKLEFVKDRMCYVLFQKLVIHFDVINSCTFLQSHLVEYGSVSSHWSLFSGRIKFVFLFLPTMNCFKRKVTSYDLGEGLNWNSSVFIETGFMCHSVQ